MRVRVSKSFLEMSRSVFPWFFKRKRTMARLSEEDRDGAIFRFLAITEELRGQVLQYRNLGKGFS